MIGSVDACGSQGGDGRRRVAAGHAGGGSRLHWIPLLHPQHQTLPVPLLQGHTAVSVVSSTQFLYSAELIRSLHVGSSFNSSFGIFCLSVEIVQMDIQR